MNERAIRLPLSYDVGQLQQDLSATRRFSTVPQFGVYHNGEWTGLSLCAEGGDAYTTKTGIVPTGQPFTYTEVIQYTPYFRQVLDGLSCPKRSVRLLHLPPGGRIERHADPPLTFQHGVLRLHIPIVTHPDVEFVIGDHRCVWQAGELWWGDFSLPHHVYNKSPINRVHIVIDVEINDFVLALFPQEFRLLQQHDGVVVYEAPISLSELELSRFVCDVTIPPGVLPMPSLENGVRPQFRIIAGELVMLVSERRVLTLRPISSNDFSVVGWSRGVTVHFETAGDRVLAIDLIVKGLPRNFLAQESVDNPKIPVNRIPLVLTGTY